LLDIPADTGLILSSVNRVDRIDAVYKPEHPRDYLNEIAGLTGTKIDHYLIMDLDGYSGMVDVLDGVTVFIPNRVDLDLDGQRVILPSGSVVLDGAKARLFALYRDPERSDAEHVEQRQLIVQTLLRRLRERSDYVSKPQVFDALSSQVRSDFGRDSLKRLLQEFARMDTDRVVLQRLTGTYRRVEEQVLLFPAWDGQLAKDIVKQTLNALLNAEATAVEDKVFTLEILNGTASRGLAQKTAEIFESFGYEVLSVANASTTDVAKTSVIDVYDEPEAAARVADVIRCREVATESAEEGSGAPVDFIVVLGQDFDGRYCVD